MQVVLNVRWKFLSCLYVEGEQIVNSVTNFGDIEAFPK